MKKTVRKLLNLFLAIAIIFTMIPTTFVFAEDEPKDDSLEIIIELGTPEEVFGNFNEDDVMPANVATIGHRIAYIPNVNNDKGYTYINFLRINGNPVFCLEPEVNFTSKHPYPENPLFWNTLSSSQKQQIWEICYYGYDYPGHQTDRYYAATQLLVWQVVKKEYEAYIPDKSSRLDVSAEINEINRLRSQPQGTPSFHNSTIKMGLNTPVTVTDTKGVLENFNVTGRELLTPDEARMLDNDYALLFIRGEKPIYDLKFDILKHPNVKYTTNGKGKPFKHGQVVHSYENWQDIELTDNEYELLSEEDMDEYFKNLLIKENKNNEKNK